MTQEEHEHLLELIQSAYDVATMEHAEFSKVWADPGDPLPVTEEQVTPFIKRRTHLWRKSWLLAPLKEALAMLDPPATENLPHPLGGSGPPQTNPSRRERPDSEEKKGLD